MVKHLDKIVEQAGQAGKDLLSQLTNKVSHNRYTLTIDELSTPISVLNVKGEEALNQLWHYTITFTSANKTLSTDAFLNQPATFSFNSVVSDALSSAIRALGDFTNDKSTRKIYGIITEFSQLSVNKEEAHYQVVLSPRLARLTLNRNCAIFQNQSVVSVVEQILRSHGLNGIDYRLELKEHYPAREFITQWQESDFEFIQRLMADVGIWFRFESHAEHDCDVMVISDYEQGYDQVAHINYKLPSGTLDGGTESVWDISMHSQTVASSVKVKDYNYRDAKANLLSEVNSQPDDRTTNGTDYRYGEHYQYAGSASVSSGSQKNSPNKIYKNIQSEQNGGMSENNDDAQNKDNDYHLNSTPESGNWYARIRHEQAISEQIIIRGKSNRYNLAPGQLISLNGAPLIDIDEGIIILSVTGSGSRTDAYQLSFTAIPFKVLKPYRPAPLAWPQVSGTLPARVTSPDNDTYGYIDTQGRYRVKFNFDLTD
ncbi:type VI secretion system Vgr family protein, partial [Gilliamella sp. Choc6-1]|uniref:type VI secretion system Vgr family protein n=1 Tax=Gilliamella sp. Choc6-1 TaxID=3120239 RepID=UPI000A6943E4